MAIFIARSTVFDRHHNFQVLAFLYGMAIFIAILAKHILLWSRLCPWFGFLLLLFFLLLLSSLLLVCILSLLKQSLPPPFFFNGSTFFWNMCWVLKHGTLLCSRRINVLFMLRRWIGRSALLFCWIGFLLLLTWHPVSFCLLLRHLLLMYLPLLW